MKLPGEYIIESSESRLFNWREVWQYRELLLFFSWRDVKVKYKQTVLGIAWALLQPVMMVTIFTLLFSRALSIPSDELPYPVYAFSGLLAWNLFSTGLSGAQTSMLSHAPIIKKVYFPRVIIPLSTILSSALDFVIAFVVFLVLLVVYQVEVDLAQAVLFWILAFLVTLVATVGPSLWLSALNVKYRDFRYVIPFVVQLLFFATPVIYPWSVVNSPVMRFALSMNPMYAAISFFRWPLVKNHPEADMILLSLACSLVVMGIGLWYFRKTEHYFADLA